MPLFPLFANLAGREVLVVGGGDVAQRKIEALLHAGAQVRLFANEVNPAIAQWLARGRLQRLEGAFDPTWLDQVWLVVAATDDRPFNLRLAAEAGQRRRLVNVVDDAELSTYQVPAIVDRDPLLVAISSGGAAPMLARRLREQLETQLDHSFGELASMFARHRERIRQRLPQLAQRRRWFERVLEGPVQALLQRGDRAQAEHAFAATLEDSDATPAAGSVLLVGTGDGDPGLLTLKALRALNQADVIVFDAAVPAAVMAMARRDAAREAIPDGQALLAVLARHAEAGQRVVCVRPGDAFRNPAGTHLREALAARGIACAIVPGIAQADGQ